MKGLWLYKMYLLFRFDETILYYTSSIYIIYVKFSYRDFYYCDGRMTTIHIVKWIHWKRCFGVVENYESSLPIYYKYINRSLSFGRRIVRDIVKSIFDVPCLMLNIQPSFIRSNFHIFSFFKSLEYCDFFFS